MPNPIKEPGFLLNFDAKGSPRPRYLGRVNADISVEDMESKIPAPGFKANGETEVHEDRSFAAFKAKMEAAVQAGKNKTKSQKEKKKKERIVSKQTWCDQLKRTQCYLGLRPRRGSVAKEVNDLVAGFHFTHLYTTLMLVLGAIWSTPGHRASSRVWTVIDDLLQPSTTFISLANENSHSDSKKGVLLIIMYLGSSN